MKCKLVKILDLCGKAASIYSVILDGEIQTLFEKFLQENKTSYISELNNILIRLQTIGHKTGAREVFFKIHEGSLGDGVSALYDEPGKMLRLYCIRYGTQIVILGGGGPKTVKKLQEDNKLLKENQFLRRLSVQITSHLRESTIKFGNDYLDFTGNLTIQDYEED